LVMAGLALQSLSLLKKADPGFRVDNILTMAFSPNQSRGFTVGQAHQFYQQLLDRVRKEPGVEAASLGHLVPMSVESSNTTIRIERYAMPEGQHSITIANAIVTDGYFDLLG